MGFISGGCHYSSNYRSTAHPIDMFPSGGKFTKADDIYPDYEEYMRNKWKEEYEDEKRERMKNFKRFWERMFEEEYGERSHPLDDEVGPEYHIDYPFNVFGLKKSASQEDMKKAYRSKILETHPDKTGEDSEDQFREVQEAYEYYRSYIL